MAYEMRVTFLSNAARTEDEARAELALFLTNRGAGEIADSASVREVEAVDLAAGPQLVAT